MRIRPAAPTAVRLLALAALATLGHGATLAADPPVIGLITKTETNPFFVKMKEGATEAGKAKGAKVLSGAGKADGDNAGQVTAMENMIAAGAKTILITPSDSKAIIPAIKKAREKGVMIIALDSPTDPADATDALFATDNYKAGVLIGQYAKAALGGKAAKIVTLDLMPGHPGVRGRRTRDRPDHQDRDQPLLREDEGRRRRGRQGQGRQAAERRRQGRR